MRRWIGFILVLLTGGSLVGQTAAADQPVSGLVVEEYPVVSAAEDTPTHFEFKQRLSDQILDVRRAWREPDAAAKVAATNEIISRAGYTLTPLPEGGNALYTLSHNGTVLFPDLDYIFPIAVSESGTDFRLVIEVANQYELLVVTPETIGQVDMAHFVSIAPVFVGNDVIELYADWDRNQFLIQRNGQTIYTVTPDGQFVEPPVKSLWSWDGHWVLEVMGDVIIDGKSTKAAAGYDEIFGWQLIAGKPFFFFNTVDFVTQKSYFGLSYDGQEIAPYRYEEIAHGQCCEPSMFNPSGNAVMVWFYAQRGGLWYYVEAGMYEIFALF